MASLIWAQARNLDFVTTLVLRSHTKECLHFLCIHLTITISMFIFATLISQFHIDFTIYFTISNLFHNFTLISQFHVDFTISHLFHNFTMISKFHNFTIWRFCWPRHSQLLLILRSFDNYDHNFPSITIHNLSQVCSPASPLATTWSATPPALAIGAMDLSEFTKCIYTSMGSRYKKDSN